MIERLRRNERGFTLVEMVCVCLLLGIVLTGVTTVMVGGSHAELQNNNRFKAQTSARTVLDIMRNDVHNACAANVGNSGALLKLAYIPSGDPTQCGASASNTKVLWCSLTSPTTSGRYALYRSTASTCTSANGILEADKVLSSALFSTASTVAVKSRQTVSVTVPISYAQSVYGQSYTLGQDLVLRNTVYQTASSTTACPATASNTTCTYGLCPFGGSACYPPVIQ